MKFVLQELLYTFVWLVFLNPFHSDVNENHAKKFCNSKCLLVAGVNLFSAASTFCNREPNSLSVAMMILQLCLYGIGDLETLPNGNKVIEDHISKLKEDIQFWISQETMIGSDSFGCSMLKVTDEEMVMLVDKIQICCPY